MKSTPGNLVTSNYHFKLLQLIISALIWSNILLFVTIMLINGRHFCVVFCIACGGCRSRDRFPCLSVRHSSLRNTLRVLSSCNLFLSTLFKLFIVTVMICTSYFFTDFTKLFEKNPCMEVRHRWPQLFYYNK